MKKFITLFSFFIICLLLSFSRYISKITTNVIINFYLNVLPLLAPTIIFNNIFIYSGGVPSLLEKSNLSNKAKHNINKFTLIFLGLVSGTPALASMINTECTNTLSKKEAQNILNCFTSPSLPFLFALLNSTAISFYLKILIIALPLIIEFIVFIINDKNNEILYNPIYNNKDNIISKSITSSAHTIVLMSGSIIIFAIISAPLKLLFYDNLLYLLQGLIEFSYPLHILLTNTHPIQVIFSIIIISFSSLSLITQVKLISPLISLKKLIKKRLIITAIVTLICVILISFLNIQ